MGITISTLDYTEEIKNKLLQRLDANFIFAEEETRDYTLFKIDFDQSSRPHTLEFLAGVIADIVIDKLEKKFINRIIKHKYHQFSTEERIQIQELTLDHLDNLNEAGSINHTLGKLVRKEEIIKQILTYLNKHQDLNVEGFVRFRLKDYLDDLKFAVERAVDDFIIEKEYNEFIDLLKYFVDLQEPRIGVVHVIKRGNDSFKIMDKNGSIINNEYLEGYLAEMFDDEVEYEDLLVSALINVAPLKIVLHFKDENTEKTVRNIFGERVEVCRGGLWIRQHIQGHRLRKGFFVRN